MLACNRNIYVLSSNIDVILLVPSGIFLQSFRFVSISSVILMITAMSYMWIALSIVWYENYAILINQFSEYIYRPIAEKPKAITL